MWFFCKDGTIATLRVFYITDDGPEATIDENAVPQIFLQARPAFRHPGYRAVREQLKCGTESPRLLRSQTWCWWQRAGNMHEALECPTVELRTKCARCRKLGPWARELPEGNQGERNDERFNRRAWRSEDNSKGFIAVAGHTARRPFLLGASWTFVALDPGEVLRDFWRREGACWGTATETVVQITGRTWPPGRVELGETGIHKRHRRHDEANRSCGRAGRVRRMQLFTVVEQDVPPLLPAGIMRTLQESLDLDDSGEKVIFRQCGGESPLRALGIENCVKTMTKDSRQITCQPSTTCT